jgi:hypothetical protein
MCHFSEIFGKNENGGIRAAVKTFWRLCGEVKNFYKENCKDNYAVWHIMALPKIYNMVYSSKTQRFIAV